MQLLRIKPSSVAAILPVSDFSDDVDVVMLTSNGQIKRTALSKFANTNARGIVAMNLNVSKIRTFAAVPNILLMISIVVFYTGWR